MRDAVALSWEEQVINRAGTMARAVDHRLGGDARLGAIVVRDSCDFVSAPDGGFNARHTCLEDAVPAAVFKVAVQIRHQRVAVDDTRRLALDDASHGSDIGFAGGCFSGADEPGRGVA
jgi:hypothetical protein